MFSTDCVASEGFPCDRLDRLNIFRRLRRSIDGNQDLWKPVSRSNRGFDRLKTFETIIGTII